MLWLPPSRRDSSTSVEFRARDLERFASRDLPEVAHVRGGGDVDVSAKCAGVYAGPGMAHESRGGHEGDAFLLR